MPRFVVGRVVLLIAGCTPTPTPAPPPISSRRNLARATRHTAPADCPTIRDSQQPAASTPIQVEQGFGAAKGFWQVYFTAPTGSRDASTYHGGIDEVLASYIDQVQHTLDIAAYEFNSPALTPRCCAPKRAA